MHSLDAYGHGDGPLTEDLPAAATTRKGRLRAGLVERLLAEDAAGTLRAAFGCAADFCGPATTSITGDRLFPAMLAGKMAHRPLALDDPHSHDFARVLVTLGEPEETLGQVWHAPPAEP